ncbi:MAG: alanine racemase [Lachnospiraceae bacterium]|nr:alanine racemase [Lachnospiraceae bacterium]
MNYANYLEMHTPAYLFDLDVFHEQIGKVKQAWGEIGLCYSVKANPFLVGKTPKILDFLEVCSPGELEICVKQGVDPAKIIFSGVNKTKESVQRAIDLSVGVLTIESLLHAKLIQEAAASKGVQVKVLLRLSAGSQFGMSEDDLTGIITDWKDQTAYANLDITGIHFFSGTQKKKAADIEKELGSLSAFLEKLQNQNSFTVKQVEYGTGLGVEYFLPSKEKDGPSPQEKDDMLLEEVSPILKAFAEEWPLTVEMGRFFAANCGSYVTEVVDNKTVHDINYVICDGGINHVKYQGQAMGMQQPVIHAVKAGAEDDHAEKNVYTICGSLCTTTDILARGVQLPKLHIGDRLVFEKTGAYSVTEGLALFLSRELPAVYLQEEDHLTLVRDVKQVFTLNS